jgi:hypothetical protein
MRLLVWVAVAASLVFVSGTPIAAGGAASPGVRGVVRLSHGCPGPVREGDIGRCDFAAIGVLVRAVQQAGRIVGGDRTDRRGRFQIVLPAGRYLLRVEVATARDEPITVSVSRSGWTTVTLRYLVPPYME